MKKRKRFVIGFATCFAAMILAWFLLPLAVSAFRAWLLTPQDCPSACKRSVPGCQPATFDLELFMTQLKKGKRYPLWYRATLRNTSCFALTELLANEFIDGHPWLTIWDSRGVEFPANAGAVPRGIIPYSFDREAFAAMKRNPEFQMSFGYSAGDGFEYQYTRLDPGRKVATLPSMLLPSLAWLQPSDMGGPPIDLSIRSKQMRPLIESRLRGMQFDQPPPGYSSIDGYIFNTPGRYRIQAELKSEYWPAGVYPRFEWYRQHVPARLQRGLEWWTYLYEHRHLLPPEPPDFRTAKDLLHVKSNVVEFEVTP
ncbi:MAG: hypothetical protein AAB320_08965 [Elusimicrobiota bacterium]